MGATSLSPQEKQILDQLLVSEPYVIAKNLGITDSTVYQHIKGVRRKYKNARAFVNLIESKYRSRGLGKYLWIKDIEK
jgi:FixJ family two-component response regulator